MSLHFAKVRGWVGAGMADAAGRLVILSATTAVLARLLGPSDFGETALILSIVTIFTVFVGAPYEEALAQRRVTRRVHLEAALAASFLTAVGLVVLSVPIGWVMDRLYDRHIFLVMLPVTACMLFAQGPLAIATAVARRRRKFYAINIAGLLGHCVGAGFALALAFSGCGIWALIGLRVGIVFANTITLMVLLRLVLVPRWSSQAVGELNRYAKYILMTRLVENLAFVVYNVAVSSFFGITVLGYANMAMRLVEPIRGAIIAVTYNLCFSFFTTVARDRVRLGEETRRISSESTVSTAPIFMGVAAISPIMVPLLAGPGWDAAVPLAVMLAIGGMVSVPSQVVLAALSAAGRPEQSTYANVAGLSAMTTVLVATIGLNTIFIGVARAAGDIVQASITMGLSGGLILLPRRALLRDLCRSWAVAALMALVVAGVAGRLALIMPALAVLPLAMVSGVLVYALLMFVFDRARFDRLRPLLMKRAKPFVLQRAVE